ncbi:MAG: histidine kinase [Marinoscillum sp.]
MKRISRAYKAAFMLSFGLLSWYTSVCQSPYLRHLTSKEGLPSSTIYSIIQDDRGYIWLGTAAGLCKYDGIHFKLFEAPNSLGSSVDNLKKDKLGRIFFKNFSNQLFVMESDSISSITLPQSNKPLKGFDLLNDGRLLVLTDDFYTSDSSFTSWKKLDISLSVDINNNSRFIADHRNHIWILETTKLNEYDSTFIRDYPIEIAHKISIVDTTVYLINALDQKIQQVSKGTLMDSFDQLSKMIKARIIDLAKDSKGRTWILSTDGAICYENNSQLLNNGLLLLNGNFVSDFLQDHEGNYWFSTIGNGLFVMYDEQTLIYDQKNSNLFYDQVMHLSKDGANNIIAATNGLESYLINERGEIITRYHTSAGDTECIFFDEKSNRVILESQVYEFDGGEPISSYYGGVTPKDIARYSDDILAIAAGDGAYLVTNPTLKHKPQTTPKNLFYNAADVGNKLQLRDQRAYSAFVDRPHDRIWIGYNDGLFYYQNGESYELRSPNGQPIIALSFAQTADQAFWISTIRQGLFKVLDTAIVQNKTINEGLVSNFCRVIRTEDNLLYLGTNKGLQVTDLNDGSSRFFNEQDGLPTDEITDVVVTENKIWISTLKGLVVLQKNFSGFNDSKPLIYLDEFDVMGISQNLDQSAEFSYDRNNVTFKLSGIALRSEGKFSYQYRLLGVDDEWRSVSGTNNEITFFTLPPGEYTFEAMSVNEDGVLSRRAVTHSFEISKPYWQRWWFIVLVLLSVIALVSSAFILRIRNINRRNKLERSLQEVSLSALNLQMNPHFIFNALASVQNYILKGNIKESVSFLSKFAKLMRQILEHSRQEFITVQEEVNMLNNYLQIQQFRFGTFDFTISVDEKIDPSFIRIPPLFAQPFVENAIEHGLKEINYPGEILISFSSIDHRIQVDIIDNGLGLKVENKTTGKHNSLATKITQERLSLLRSRFKEDFTLSVNDRLDKKGTIVSVIIPAQF